MGLPAGTVTFVFTDIEGSTALFRRLGDGYPPLLARHDELLRVAWAAEGGHVVKTVGDAFFVAFADAPAAVRACVDAQRRVAAEPWPEGAPIRVRMGVHTGPATPAGGDYVALAVHRAARVASAGHGGQILLSDTARALARGALAPPLELRPLGSFVLKDFDAPEPLHQVTHPGLPSEFPALRTLSAQGHNLPTGRTSFVGRETEVGSVKALLAEQRLVTLSGPGGVGKTRLATEVGAELPGLFPDGVWLVELASVEDADGAVHAVAAALGVAEEPGRALRASVLDRAARRRLLLVVDNCEHLAGAAAGLVADLLAAGPGVHVLATSRVPLGVEGELVRRIAPLGLPAADASVADLAGADAARLFLERALQVRPDLPLTEETAAGVAEVVRRLDGIPLALELAAARCRAMTPAEIARRLDDRFRLVRGDRGRAEHQRTLEATVAWSHQLLSEAQRVLLRRLSAFAGSFTLEAAEAVCGGDRLDEGDVLDLLFGLVDQSLVLVDDDGATSRYRLLETVREFARARLADAGEADAAHQRHLAWAVSLAEQAGAGLDGPDEAAWTRTLELEHDNLAAAFRWSATRVEPDPAQLRLAAALGGFWRRGAHFREGIDHLMSALAAGGGAPGRAHATALRDLGFLLHRAGRAEEARQMVERALAAARSLGDPALVEAARADLAELAAAASP